MNPSATLDHVQKVLYSTDEFSVIEDNGTKTLRPKSKFGRLLPFIQKDGVVEGVLLPKEEGGMIRYPSKGFNQLKDAMEYCGSKEWQISKDAFIHLGFWRTSDLVDASECVWGIDCQYDEMTSKLIGDRELVVVPVGFISRMGDSVAAAALLKLVVHLQLANRDSEK